MERAGYVHTTTCSDFTQTVVGGHWDSDGFDAGPVIVSVPHDGIHNGGDFDGLLEVRPRRPHGIHGYDRYVWPIARDVLHILPMTIIRGLCPRRYIDYNRPDPRQPFPEETQAAFVDGETNITARRIHQAYHGAIARRIETVVQYYGRDRCLLIDLHGFGKQPAYAPEGGFDLIFGTDNRRTIHFGSIDEQLGDWLTRKGYAVFVPRSLPTGDKIDDDDLVEDWYSAGYTTRYYAQKYGINAIQIEIARRFRQKDATEAGRALSYTIGLFLRNYYLGEKWP